MRILDLFSGIGGFSLAGRWMGWETAAFVEWEDFCQRVLKHHYPGVPVYGDITKFSYEREKGKIGPIDIVCGGDPCQPHSQIGRRGGDDDERFLWPEKLRIIKESQPLCVVNENVLGSISNSIVDQKASDLERIGYTCWPPLIVGADYAGGAHIRKRIWLVAYSAEGRLERRDGIKEEGQRQRKIGSAETLVDVKDGALSPKSKFLQQYDGLSGRLDDITFSKWRRESIKALGNSVVPQVVFEIFKAIEKFENTKIKP